MFTTNFASGQYGSSNLTTTYTESGGTVSGSARVDVPMTIMKIFGIRSRSASVTCTARMDLPNTDVMFVLDVTYSMQCAPSATSDTCSPASTGSRRIDGLKKAVKCFYEALEKVATPEVCTASDPTTTTATTTAQIRIGFVPYGVNVNVGKILPQADLANSWTYQSRQAVLNATASVVDTSDYPSNPSWSSYSSTVSTHNNINSSSACNALVPGQNSVAGLESTATNQAYNTAGTLVSYQTTTPYTDYQYTYSYSSSSKVCTIKTSKKRTYTRTTTYAKLNHYEYKPIQTNVSGLKNADGTNWNNSITLDVGPYGAARTVTWDGCVEEAQTFQNTDGDASDDWATIPTSAFDMNVNLIPNTPSTATWFTDATHFGPGSYWGPMLADGSNGAVWARYPGTNTSSWTQSEVDTSSDLSQSNYSYLCTASAARKLTEYRTSTDFVSYVDSLSATDLGTYHDIGMLWGARLLSPTGIFASDNAATPSGGAIQRHLIFMTDGNTHTVHNNYTAYGLNYFNRYQFSADASDTQADNLTNARLVALCNEIKNMNITLWVVSYGNAVNSTTQSRLSACATDSSHFFNATDTATLISNFQTIASKISALRLTS